MLITDHISHTLDGLSNNPDYSAGHALHETPDTKSASSTTSTLHGFGDNPCDSTQKAHTQRFGPMLQALSCRANFGCLMNAVVPSNR